MRKRYKHSIAAFCLMVFAFTQAEGTLHAWLHLSAEHGSTTHEHHSCRHSNEVAKSSDYSANPKGDINSVEEDHQESCARCAHFLIHDHNHIASLTDAYSIVHEDSQLTANAVAVISFYFGSAAPRGPPQV